MNGHDTPDQRDQKAEDLADVTEQKAEDLQEITDAKAEALDEIAVAKAEALAHDLRRFRWEVRTYLAVLVLYIILKSF